jgi:branched-chain amino acid transport system substrate-binding protein
MRTKKASMKPIVIACFAIILALLPLGARAADPYEINVILSLSGIVAFLGNQEATALKALETVENKRGGINGRPIKFTIVDDASSPVNAVQLANQIIAKKVPVILGSSLTASCDAIYSLVKANGPVLYCFSPALHTPPGSFGFSAGASTADISTAAIRYYRERGLTRIALISSTDASGADGETVVLRSMSLPENKNMQLVANEHFGIADINVAAQVSRIKAANPQVIIAWTSGTPTGTVLHSLHDAGLDVPTQLNAANIVRAQLRSYAAFAPTELYLPGFRFMTPETVAKGPLHDAQQAFFAALAAQGVSPPEVSHSLAYDSAKVVIDALRTLPPDPTAVQLRDAIEQTHGVSGVSSLLDYRDGGQRGIPISAVVIIRWDGAKETFVPVSKPGGAYLTK